MQAAVRRSNSVISMKNSGSSSMEKESLISIGSGSEHSQSPRSLSPLGAPRNNGFFHPKRKRLMKNLARHAQTKGRVILLTLIMIVGLFTFQIVDKMDNSSTVDQSFFSMSTFTPQLSSQVVRLPTVQLIGAQKAGTTAIATWLYNGGFRRPKVFDGEPHHYRKEVHFFDLEWRYKQGIHFYADRFKNSTHNLQEFSLTLDATPNTLPFAERVRTTYEAAGGGQAHTVKIIVILREPISRELSLYNHLAFACRNFAPNERTTWHNQVVNEDGSIMSFDDFILQKSVPSLERESDQDRLYAKHLQKWFKLFDRGQILILSYDELQNQPKQLQERLETFLGCKIPGELPRSNSKDSEHKVLLPTPAASKAIETLRGIFTPLNEELYELLESNPGQNMEQRPFPRFEDSFAE